MKEFYFLDLKKAEQDTSRERNKPPHRLIFACEYLCNRVDEWKSQETKQTKKDTE